MQTTTQAHQSVSYHASARSYNKGAYSSDFGYAVNDTHLNGLANEGGEEEERGNGEEEDGFVIPSGSLSFTVR